MIEYGVPFEIGSTYGTLSLNGRNESENRFILDPTRCKSGVRVRAQADDLPQKNGSILPRAFVSGYFLDLAIQYWPGGSHCGAASREMHDELMLHVNAMLWQEGSVSWEPTGFEDGDVDMRQLRRLRWSDDLEVEIEDDGKVTVTTHFQTRYPYEVDVTEVATEISDGATATITNEGNTDYWPRVVIGSGTSSFTITNLSIVDDEDTPAELIFSDAIPGASALAGGEEYDFFENSGVIPGIDILNSDFFPLAPGDNDITVTGTNITVYSRNAWAG